MVAPWRTIDSPVGREARLAFTVSTPIRRERAQARRFRALPINAERTVALALNVVAWVVIWAVGGRLLGR